MIDKTTNEEIESILERLKSNGLSFLNFPTINIYQQNHICTYDREKSSCSDSDMDCIHLTQEDDKR